VRYVVRPAVRALPVLGVIVLAYLVLFPTGLLARRLIRRRRTATPLEQVELAWTEAVEAASVAGFSEQPSDTYVERAIRLGEVLPQAADPALTLASRLEVGSYSAEGADLDDAEVAWEAASAIGAAARAHASWWDRVLRWFDPRWLLRSWRQDRAARQRRITLTPRADLEQERELVGSPDRG
jgi:hypothetical protein